MPQLSDGKIRENLRNAMLEHVIELLNPEYETILRIKGNKVAIACVDEQGDDRWAEITIAIPTGDRDDHSYDAEGMAEDYQFHLKELTEKAEARKAEAEKKAKEREERRAKKKGE